MIAPLIGIVALGVPVIGIFMTGITGNLAWLLLILPGMFAEDLLWTTNSGIRRTATTGDLTTEQGE